MRGLRLPFTPRTSNSRGARVALALGILACSPLAAQNAPFATGADASWYTQMVHDSGYVFRTQQGIPEPCLNVLQSVGINAVRLRVWLNPAGGWCNQADVVSKALAANALGQRVMIDFHFSDTWASGANQAPPAAWVGYGLSQMEAAVAGEVSSVLGAIQAAGGSVAWVQLGNEINSGMLFPLGEVGGSGNTGFGNLAGLINAGYGAVKAVFPGAQVIVHLSSGENDSVFEWFFDNLKAAGGRFDVIGMSAYPFWANLPWQTEVTQVVATLNDMKARYGVPTMVCECGYAESDPADTYSYLQALVQAARQAGALGVFYWEPECYGSWPSAANGGTYAMGAFTSSGEPSAGLNAFADSGVAPYYPSQTPSVTMASGSTVLLSAPSPAFPAPSYQWSLNGAPVAGATGPVLLLAGATAANAGAYTCAATNAAGSATSAPAALSVVQTPNPGRLVNLSTRAQVGTGGSILIAGFVVGGPGTSGAQTLLLRGSGPALAAFGVSGVLPDPQLTLNGPPGFAALVKEGWGGSAAVSAAASQVGAFAWTDPTSHDAALVATVPGGAYTAAIAGQGGDTGVALAEVYDATPAGAYTPSTPRLINLSARVQVGSAGDILIAGFVVGGSTSKTLLVRASGPALAAFAVPGYLPDPLLQIFRSESDGTSTLLQSSKGWGGSAQTASVAASVGAFSWGASATPDSALLLTLPPGAYTAQVSGATGDTGVALVEVYEVP